MATKTKNQPKKYLDALSTVRMHEKTTETKTKTKTPPTHDEIALCAYLFWEHRVKNGEAGTALDDWLMAETYLKLGR